MSGGVTVAAFPSSDASRSRISGRTSVRRTLVRWGRSASSLGTARSPRRIGAIRAARVRAASSRSPPPRPSDPAGLLPASPRFPAGDSIDLPEGGVAPADHSRGPPAGASTRSATGLVRIRRLCRNASARLTRSIIASYDSRGVSPQVTIRDAARPSRAVRRRFEELGRRARAGSRGGRIRGCGHPRPAHRGRAGRRRAGSSARGSRRRGCGRRTGLAGTRGRAPRAKEGHGGWSARAPSSAAITGSERSSSARSSARAVRSSTESPSGSSLERSAPDALTTSARRGRPRRSATVVFTETFPPPCRTRSAS